LIDEIINTTYSPTLSGYELKIQNKIIIFELLHFIKEKFCIKSNDLDHILKILKNMNEDKLNKRVTKNRNNIDDLLKNIFSIKGDKGFEDERKQENSKADYFINLNDESKNIEEINMYDDISRGESLILSEETNKIKSIIPPETKQNETKLLIDSQSLKNNHNIDFGNTVQSVILNEENKDPDPNVSINLDVTNNSIYTNYLDFLKSKNDFLYSDLNKSLDCDVKTDKKVDDDKKNCEDIEKEYFMYKLSENIELVLSHGILNFQFKELKPFYFRKLFFDQIFELFFLIPKLSDIKFSDLKTDSWLAIMWNPYKFSNNLFNNTSFISLINLKNNILKEMNKENSKNISSQEKIHKKSFIQEAILPIKLQKEIFLEALGKKTF